MKRVKVEDAVGLTLCHDITAVRDGFKGALFHRGQVVRQEDIPALLDIGKRTLFIWEPQAGEIHEEDAALRMAAMAPCPGADYTGPSEGKMTLTARQEGLFRVDTALLHRLNSIEDITISTLADHYPVRAGARLAGLRIVPLVTKERHIAEAEALCAEKKLFDLRPYRRLKAGIVVTGSEVYHGRIRDRFEPIVREKLGAFPCDILGCTFCDDELPMLSAAVQRYLDAGAGLIVLTGGMSVDPDDLTPSAIAASGARVVTRGVPSQPGNMFTLAYRGDVCLIGVPGAAIHSKTTMFDVALPQIFTGDPFTREDFIRLGDGGLCQQCPVCHFPNCTFGRY